MLLLVQAKISATYRRAAIRLLGSEEDREIVFLQYHMIEDLSRLYVRQGRQKDLFYLLVNTGDMEGALRVVTEYDPELNIPKHHRQKVFEYAAGERCLSEAWSVLVSGQSCSNIIRTKH